MTEAKGAARGSTEELPIGTLFAGRLLRWLTVEDPEPGEFMNGLGAVFATYCHDAQIDPVWALRSIIGHPIMDSIRTPLLASAASARNAPPGESRAGSTEGKERGG